MKTKLGHIIGRPADVLRGTGFLVTLIAGLLSADAATYVWKGTGTTAAPTAGNWNVGTNWDVAAVSGIDTELVFASSATSASG